jgi:hypothetical protein
MRTPTLPPTLQIALLGAGNRLVAPPDGWLLRETLPAWKAGCFGGLAFGVLAFKIFGPLAGMMTLAILAVSWRVLSGRVQRSLPRSWLGDGPMLLNAQVQAVKVLHQSLRGHLPVRRLITLVTRLLRSCRRHGGPRRETARSRAASGGGGGGAGDGDGDADPDPLSGDRGSARLTLLAVPRSEHYSRLDCHNTTLDVVRPRTARIISGAVIPPAFRIDRPRSLPSAAPASLGCDGRMEFRR